MRIEKLEGVADIDRAALLAGAEHSRLRSALPFLPEKGPSDFRPRIDWMRREGGLLGLFEGSAGGGSSLVAFVGGFIIGDWRNAGAGAFSPDWCHGSVSPDAAFDAYRELYRALAPAWIERGARIHAASAYTTDEQWLSALSMTGFGRIMWEAARPVAGLARGLSGDGSDRGEGRIAGGTVVPRPLGVLIRRAGADDAEALAELDAGLASHIASSPVLMPDPRGRKAEEWAAWFGERKAVAFAAQLDGRIVGFLKAQEPQVDVSFAVHDELTLAINGLFVAPEMRGRGVGRALLAAMALYAEEAEYSMLSVDCETLNPEAYGFWSRWMEGLAFGLERRA
jgi:Acetyltransferases